MSIVDLLGTCLDYIKETAVNISETFTGAGSGAVLVMLIFYLVLLILILLLFRSLVKVGKRFFNEIFIGRKKEKTNNLNTAIFENNTELPIGFPVIASLLDFDKQPLLDSLSSDFNKMKEIDKGCQHYQHLSDVAPQLLVISKPKDVKLTATDRENITNQIKDKTLNELCELLTFSSESANTVSDNIESLNNSLKTAYAEREKLAKEEISLSSKYNSVIDELIALKDKFEENKTRLSVEYSELYNFIIEIDTKKSVILDTLKEIEENMPLIPGKVESFGVTCAENVDSFVSDFRKMEEVLTALNTSYSTICETGAKTDENILVLQKNLEEAIKEKALTDELISVLKPKISELEQLEKERLAREEKARLEREAAEQKAREEQERKARVEAERIAKLEAEKAERERLANLEAERIAKETAERKAKEEQERKLRIAAEQERLAKLEADRIAKETAEQQAREEAERVAEAQRVATFQSKTADVVLEAEGQQQTVVTKPISAMSSDAIVDKVKHQMEHLAQNSYTLNFDNISPATLEKLAQAKRNRQLAAEKAIAPANVPVVEQSADVLKNGADLEEDNEPVVDSNDNIKPTNIDTAESNEPDYMSQLKQQWAAEREHKAQWAAEQARKKAEELRRKEELSKKMAEESSNTQ